MKRLFVTIVAGVALLLLCLTGANKPVAADDKISVVTTFYPVYEFTKAVTGDTADVTMLVKAGIQIHHTFYISGKMPWEYDINDMRVLCKKCHQRIHNIQ